MNKNDSNLSLQQFLEISRYYSLSEMSKNLAHDINNPLFLVQGQVHKLKRKFKNGELDEKGLSLIMADIDKFLNDASSLVKNVSNFAINSTSEEMEYIKLSELVFNTLKFCRHKFKKYNIEIIEDNKLASSGVYCYPAMALQSLLSLTWLLFNQIDNSGSKTRQIEFATIEVNNQTGLSVSTFLGELAETFIEEDEGLNSSFEMSKGLMSRVDGKLSYNCKNGKITFNFEFPDVEE